MLSRFVLYPSYVVLMTRDYQVIFIAKVAVFERKYPSWPTHDDCPLAEGIPTKTELETMRFVYPTILALFECLGAATLKSVTALGLLLLGASQEGCESLPPNGTLANSTSNSTSTCAAASGCNNVPAPEQIYNSPAFYVAVALWLFSIVNIFVWLRKVYEKFKTTECLPTEIGMTTFLSIFTALLFFQEYALCDATSLMIGMLALNATFIVCGIAVMTLSDARAVDSKITERETHHYIRASLLQSFSPMFDAKSKWKTAISAVKAANTFAEPAVKKSQRSAHRGEGRGGSILVELDILNAQPTVL